MVVDLLEGVAWFSESVCDMRGLTFAFSSLLHLVLNSELLLQSMYQCHDGLCCFLLVAGAQSLELMARILLLGGHMWAAAVAIHCHQDSR